MSPSAPPPSAPSAVPVDHVRYCTEVEPNSSQRSNVPSPRAASAHEASTTVWPCAARHGQRPGSDGASATPIIKKREFISVPAPIAAATPPPAAMIAIDANWAEPAKTISDITIAATADSPASRATMPNVSATRKPAIANGTPSRKPLRKRSLGVAVSVSVAVTP